MLHNYRDIRHQKIKAKDGELGTVHDLFFDDHEWTVRYVVVDTGDWLPGQRVLIAPQSVEKIDWEESVMQVDLTVEQIEKSPPIEEHQPISRDAEQHLVNYFAWPMWWGPLDGVGQTSVMHPPRIERGIESEPSEKVEGERENLKAERRDPNLQSMRDVTGYDIHAVDGELGDVHDFLLDEDRWAIRYVAVDTHKWLPGKKVLIAPDWIQEVRWEETEVTVDLTREQIKDAPAYDPSKPVDRDFEVRLHDHFRGTRT